MKIFLDGYFDKNLGDDLMMTLAARSLTEHELYSPVGATEIENVRQTDEKKGFDWILRVIGSGFLIRNNSDVLYRVREILRDTRRARRRAVIGCNIDSFPNALIERVIGEDIKRYDYISVRDSFSQLYIQKNILHTRCERYPDMVFSLPDGMLPSVRRENILGISVREGMDCLGAARAADAYSDAVGADVLLMCFDTGGENDEAAANIIYSLSKRKKKFDIVKYDNISNMLKNLGRCSVILGVRLHACVLAARMNIPFVPAVYSEKTRRALSYAGYAGEYADASSLDSARILRKLIDAPPPDFSYDVFTAAKGHIEGFKKYIYDSAF